MLAFCPAYLSAKTVVCPLLLQAVLNRATLPVVIVKEQEADSAPSDHCDLDNGDLA